MNPNDRPSASQLLKVPTLQPHIRSYLLHAKNNSRAKSVEKLNLLPSVSQESTTVSTFRDNLTSFTTNKSASVHKEPPADYPSSRPVSNKNDVFEPIYINNHVASAYNSSKTYSVLTVGDRVDIAQTDSAYGSETEQTTQSIVDRQPFIKQTFDSHKGTASKIFSVVATAKEPKYEKLSVSRKDQITESSKSDEIPCKASNCDSSTLKIREDKGHKRSSYIEAIASTDQSMSSSSSLKSQSCKSNTNTNNHDVGKQKDEEKRKKILRRRSSDFVSKKASIEAAAAKARRRSCEVAKTSSSTKLKIPRRLSVDSLGDKKELEQQQKQVDRGNKENYNSNNKPKIKNSLSTLKKFMRRNSKSNYEAIDDETLTANEKEVCQKSANQQTHNLTTQNTIKNASSNNSKKSAKATNFIERNKKLAETPKAKPSCSTTAGNRKTNRTALSSVSESTTPAKQQQQQRKKSCKTPKSAEKLLKSHKDETINNHLQNVTEIHGKRDPTLDVPLLRQRSLTFESRETFMKFGKSPSSMVKNERQTDRSNADTTELDCIEVFTKYDQVSFCIKNKPETPS